MHSLLKSFVAVAVVCSTLSFAQPQGEVVIRSRDGKPRLGRILSETSKGYLLSGPEGTQVIEFKNIIDIKQIASSAPMEPTPMPSSTPPPPPPSVQPAVAAAPVAPVAPVASAPPPPPERPIEAPIAEVTRAEPVRERSVREGFHFGLGAGVMVLPFGPMAQLQAHFEFNFGRPVYRINANVGLVSLFGAGIGFVTVDNLFQFNVSDIYAFGGGLQLGIAAGGFGGTALAGAVLQPMIIKLGERGQHQLHLTGVLSGIIGLGALPQVYLGYSYLF